MRNIAYKFLGLLEIYIGLTGKNLQRVVSNFPIDGKEHTSQDYIDAIFWNWQNYVMVLLDTALSTFFTSAASSWSRDVFLIKKIKQIPLKSINLIPVTLKNIKKYLKHFYLKKTIKI